jgi:hypothetical protein
LGCFKRRLARDVERAAETDRALFQIAMIKLMARRIARFRDCIGGATVRRSA